MARQATSSLGGIAGVFVGVVIIGALVATPIYISSLSTDSARLNSETGDAVETVRRAVLNLDEHLLRVSRLSAASEPADAPTGPVEIPDADRAALNQLTQRLQQAETRDAERGTQIDSQRVPTGPARPDQLKSIIAEHNKLMGEAKRALSELDAATVGEARGGTSLAGARIKALYRYASARVELNHVAFLHWRADQALHDASRLTSQLSQMRSLAEAVGAFGSPEQIESIDARMASIEDEARKKSAQLAELDGTIEDYRARIEGLDAASRQNRLQMADMQMRSERIDGESGRYAQLSAEARRAEAEADALRFGTLQDATPVLRNPEDLVPLEYEGGTPIIGLFALEQVADSLREQIANLQASREALTAQKRHYDTTLTGIDATVDQTIDDAQRIAAAVDARVAEAQSIEAEINTAVDAAVRDLQQSIAAARTAAGAAAQWKRDMSQADAGPESPAGQLNALISADGHMEGSMHFLLGECAYRLAAARAEQIRLVRDIHDAITRASKVTQSEIPPVPSDRIDTWRAEALEQLAVAEKAYDKAKTLFPASRAQLAGRALQGKDTVWQALAAKASVHLLRATLQEERAARIAEKDAAYELLKTAAQGREQSELMSPAIDMILELQANPS